MNHTTSPETCWQARQCCCVSRRRFLVGCAGCALASGTTLTNVSWSGPVAPQRPKVRVIFCQPKNDQPIWPNIGYDFAAREKHVLQLLDKRCPDVHFLPASVVNQSSTESSLLAQDHEVDGYIVHLLGLAWGYPFQDFCTTGKPTLLVDNLFGGSGLFLTQLGQIRATGKPVDWVSSSNDDDLVAAARQFALLAEGRSASEVAARFRAVRHERTPRETDWMCEPDEFQTTDMEEALDRLRDTRILVVGGGWGGDQFARAAREVTGVAFIPLAFEELAAAYEAVDPAASRAFAERWIDQAESVVEPSKTDILNAGAVHGAMADLMAKHQATGVSINCLGGFYGGHLQAYPCLGFAQLNNDGMVGGCEGDQMSALTMAVMGTLVRRPGLISDPVIDTSKNQIIYAHCVAMTKPFGTDGATAAYRIRSHSEDRKGAAIQALLPAGYMTTTLEINPETREVLFHQAESAGNNPSDVACRTKLEAYVKGDIERLTENWRMGWHRVTFFGDLRAPVEQLCERLQLKLIEEA